VTYQDHTTPNLSLKSRAHEVEATHAAVDETNWRLRQILYCLHGGRNPAAARPAAKVDVGESNEWVSILEQACELQATRGS
jgi:hypothetical protein